jgi:periplasmic divalent cation tolerance protein
MIASDFVVVLSTAPSAEKAAALAHALVGEKLVACVNLVPGVRSIYAWEGKVQDESEILMLMKTRRDRVEALLARLPELHPYQTPELVVVELTAGLPAYLTWIDACVR